MVELERRAGLANVGDGDGPGETEVGQAPTTTGYASPDPEPGKAVPRRRRTLQQAVAEVSPNAPRVDVNFPDSEVVVEEPRLTRAWAVISSPIHLLTIVSFFMTLGIFIAGILWQDGTALLALLLSSLTMTTIGYAARWTPLIARRIVMSDDALKRPGRELWAEEALTEAQKGNRAWPAAKRRSEILVDARKRREQRAEQELSHGQKH